MTKYPREL